MIKRTVVCDKCHEAEAKYYTLEKVAQVNSMIHRRNF